MYIDHLIAKYGISLFLIVIAITSSLQNGIYSQCSEISNIAVLLQLHFLITNFFSKSKVFSPEYKITVQ